MKILTVGGFALNKPFATLGADSALLREGEPLFVPDNDIPYHSLIMPAIRISRRGTAISERHAAAYCDSVSAFHVLAPAAERQCVNGIPTGAMDRTFAPGHWSPFDASAAQSYLLNTSKSPIGGNISAEASIEFTAQSLNVAKIIAWLSGSMTFKTGDIILFADYGACLGAVTINTMISADLNGVPTLNFRIK